MYSYGFNTINIGDNDTADYSAGFEREVDLFYDDIVVSTEYIGPISTTGPTRSEGGPTGVQPENTQSVTLTVKTDVQATCTYGGNGETGGTYPLANPMTGTGGTGEETHTATVSGLTNGGSYSRNIMCQEDGGDANDTDYVVSWSVASGTSTAQSTGTIPFITFQ
jgi:hypothetical protein